LEQQQAFLAHAFGFSTDTGQAVLPNASLHNGFTSNSDFVAGQCVDLDGADTALSAHSNVLSDSTGTVYPKASTSNEFDSWVSNVQDPGSNSVWSGSLGPDHLNLLPYAVACNSWTNDSNFPGTVTSDDWAKEEFHQSHFNNPWTFDSALNHATINTPDFNDNFFLQNSESSDVTSNSWNNGPQDANTADLMGGTADVNFDSNLFWRPSMDANYYTGNTMGGNDLGFNVQGREITTQGHFQEQHGYHTLSPSSGYLDQDIQGLDNDSSISQGTSDSNSTPPLNSQPAAPSTGSSESPPSNLNPLAATSTPRHQCTYPPCTKTFKRDYERVRHGNSMHVNTQGAHLCPIAGCSKSQGKGYSRPDKVTEHLWKKHGNLGYAKA
jgi:hypothetical protein